MNGNGVDSDSVDSDIALFGDLDPALVLHFELERFGSLDGGSIEVTYDHLVELLARLALDAESEMEAGNRRPLNIYRKIAILLLVNENKRGRGPLPKSLNVHHG